MIRRCVVFFNLGVLFSILFWISPCPLFASDGGLKKILYISSYHPGFPTFFQQVDGIKAVFEGRPILLDIEFMDTKRFPGRENLDNFYRSLSTKLSRTDPYDAFITGDDNALLFVLAHQQDLFRNYPVVFMGVNNVDRALEQNANSNITGVVEAVSMKETLELMTQLHPGVKSIVALADNSPTGKGNLKTFYQSAPEIDAIVYSDISLSDYSFDDFSLRLRELDKESVVLLLAAYVDKNGKSLLFHDSLQLIKENLSPPIYGLQYHGLGEGILGGKVINHHYQGKAAAEITLEVLEGRPIGDIPVMSESPNSYIFDDRELQRFGLNISDLPKGSIILNEPRSYYQENKKLVWTVICIFFGYSVLVIGMWVNIMRRKRAEKALWESTEGFRSFFESAASGMAILSPEGDAIKVNPTFCRISGYSEAEVLEKNVLEVIHPDDREETRRLYEEIRTGRRQVIDMEKRYLCKDGSTIWGHATVGGVFDPDGSLHCFAVNVLDITERKKAEEALLLSEEKFRTVFNNAASGMVTLSTEGCFIEVNEAFCDFIGYSRDELLNLRVPDITHPDDLEITEENYRHLGAGQSRTINYQKRYLCKEGKIVWGHVSVASVAGSDGLPLYYIGLVQDITESRRIQDQIRESQQMLQVVLDYIPQHVFWKDLNSVYRGCNRNFARAAGVQRPQDLIGKTDYDLAWKKDESDFFRESDRRVMKSDSPELHIIEPQLQANGKQAWLDTNKIPLHNGEGKVIGILGTFEDITERKRAEEALVEANRELDAFAYTVSHDLRTPLTPIIGYAEMLQETCRDRLDEQSLECLAEIESQGNRMLALMEDLLILAQVGHMQQPFEPVDLDEVVEEVLVDLGSFIAEAGVVVEKNHLPKLQVPRTLLAQIFNNLIGNAIRYSGRAGSPIEVGGERTGDMVRLYVLDHGQGFPQKERSRIFELFYRGAAGKKTPGSGVGLATVMKISRRYGGRAWAEETPGGGSTFWVELKDIQDSDDRVASHN